MRLGRLVVFGVLASTASCATTHPENPAMDVFPPGLNGSTNVTYYDIHGRTAGELVAEMRRLGPKSVQGSFFGETQSPIRWDWKSKNVGIYCQLVDVHVRVESNMTLPRWTPPADTVPGLVAQWRTFLTALETHEVGHKDISARAAHDVQRALERYSGSCGTLASETRRLTDPIVERERSEQAAYDATTRHGATQGALFPPRRTPVAPPKEL